MSDIFFSVGCKPGNLLARFFPPKISLQDIFFWNDPWPSQKESAQKSNGRPLKSTKHLVIWQILICQSFPKAFETIEDKTLKGRGEEFVSTYP